MRKGDLLELYRGLIEKGEMDISCVAFDLAAGLSQDEKLADIEDKENIQLLETLSKELGYSREEINDILEDYAYETLK